MNNLIDAISAAIMWWKTQRDVVCLSQANEEIKKVLKRTINNNKFTAK